MSAALTPPIVEDESVAASTRLCVVVTVTFGREAGFFRRTRI
jgi:hypothetical protein